MNIDFHFGYVYVVARLGGLSAADAEVVAHACQYIDDSTVDGILEFKDGQSYERFAAAHGMIDYRNMERAKDRVVWAPFHFFPGGQGDSLEDKAICIKNGSPAREMVAAMLLRCQGKDNALHQLGVALHVYVDTWAHQGFSGVLSARNVVHKLESDHHPGNTWELRLKAILVKEFQAIGASFIDLVSKLGHGAALHFPDLPWARWRYQNGLGHQIERVNLPDFVEAADAACKVVQAFLNKTSEFQSQPGLSTEAKITLTQLMGESQSEDPDERLQLIGEAVKAGRIPGLKEDVPSYVAKGKGSWKFLATGIASLTGDGGELAPWTEGFEHSDYRKFHDAVKEHRFHVMQEILPKYGVRLA